MTKLVHIMLAAPFREGFGYQENILSAKHRQLEYDTSVITFCLAGDTAGCYVNKDGVTVYRLEVTSNPLKRVPFVCTMVRKTNSFYETLSVIAPDIIFVHGMCVADYSTISKYKRKHPEIKIFADNHSDYYNSPVNTIKQKLVHYTVLRFQAKCLANSCEKVFGVSPWRVQYLHDVLGIPASKTDLLVMGGDEKLVDWEHRSEVRERIRDKYYIPQDAFLIVTGGKIDKAKNIHLLVDAVKQIPNAYLLIFGKYEKDMVDYPNEIKCERVINVGWIPSDEAYPHFLAADLGCFPGTHSVLWEQACTSGLPCIFKDWNGGFDHVDVGGNAILIKDVTVDNLKQNISSLMENPQKLEAMAEVAGTVARKKFSYIEIAKKAING